MNGAYDITGIRGGAHLAPAGAPAAGIGYLGRAVELLRQAEVAAPAERLELAYQAALRVSGALQVRRPRRRRTAGHGAWERLRRAAPEYAGWADRFEAYQPVRERVRIGLDRQPDPELVRAVAAAAADFLAEAEAEFGVLPAVA